MRAVFLAIIVTLILTGCASSGLMKGEFSKASLTKKIDAGIYNLIPCSVAKSIGILTSVHSDNLDNTPYCVESNFASEAAWAYLFVNGEGVVEFCYSMVGYAADGPNGETEVGLRVNDCHLIKLGD